MFQRNRQYKLVIGDSRTGEGVAIETLHITFDVSKTADNKKTGNSAAIEVYNLSDETLKKFTKDFIVCELFCGYREIGMQRIAYGEVTTFTTRQSGADRVTQLILGEGYVALTQQVLSTTVPSGKTVADVIEAIRLQMPGVVRGIYAGTNINNPVVFGYPLSGSPRAMLQEVSKTYALQYTLNDSTLSVTDEGGLTENSREAAFVLNKDTGLIELPFVTAPDGTKPKGDEARRQGVQFKALLNPSLIPNRIVKIESKTVNGFFKVTSTRHYGGYRDSDWYVEGYCELPPNSLLR